MQITSTEIKNWWNSRKVSDVVLDSFKISWNGREIIIPVLDQNGKALFNKYRRSPFADDSAGPKYRYDKGASINLYNEQTLLLTHKDEPIFILEGEGDVLALTSAGLSAVTATGGAGSFQAEWVSKFDDFNNIFICLDNDEAGVTGAIKIQSLMPRASIVILPSGIKDVTEFLQKFSKKEFMELPSERFYIPVITDDKKKMFKEFKSACDMVQETRKGYIQRRWSTFYIDIINDYLFNKYESYRQMIKARLSFAERECTVGDRITQAKSTPITNYVEFNRQGYATCLWHKESSASMFYNNFNSKYPNTVKCFGCNRMCSVIDVVMELYNIDLNKAVDLILGSTR